MISREKLFQVIIKGRLESYVKRNLEHNPYRDISGIYKWFFELRVDQLIFTDSYRGYNPYSGVEYIYQKGSVGPIWYCDYVGYVVSGAPIPVEEVYAFLKEGRKDHLLGCNGRLVKNHTYMRESLMYQTLFQGDEMGLLQIENIYYKDRLIAQHTCAGSCYERELDVEL